MILLVFGLFHSSLLGQETQRPYRTYRTQKHQQQLLEQHPGIYQNILAIEEYIKNYEEPHPLPKHHLAIVFHVFYPEGQSPLDKSDIMLQIDELNESFKKRTNFVQSDWHSKVRQYANKAAKMDITFCLPASDETGQPTTAIHYYPVSRTIWEDPEALKSAESGGANPWNPEKYINIWVANLKGDLAGYAQMPGGPLETDGIVINNKFFGLSDEKPYGQGRTLVHLLGSYLGLHELWNETHLCSDDFVEDTPIHNAPNYSLGTYYHHVSICPDKPIEMIINYMDNTDDEALFLFTAGQRRRVKAILSEEGPRATLAQWGASSCGKLPNNDNRISTITSQSAPSTYSSPRFVLYPNPVKDKVRIKITNPQEEPVVLLISDLLNRPIFYQDFRSMNVEVELPFEDFASGLYIVALRNKKGLIQTQKLVFSQ